ncbi:hypothetical protein ACIOZM_15895 [Pseudomonas sp. NPDC087346]|uniref:hypothetical protein n=1 Tax=Pseudomonas sp. NPDC087346 TaxID=3364438 RepID=UPI00380E10FE
MAGDSNSREQNFWPGFVDALTNVVLVMVFVVVVFAISMFSSMLKISKVKVEQSVEKKVEERSVQAKQLVSQAQAETQVERERAERLQEENQRLSEALGAAQQIPFAEGDPAAPSRNTQPQSPVTISGRRPSINVSYALGVTTLEEKLIAALDGALGGYESAGRWKVLLQASMAEPSPSEARRLAFYRIAVLRDHLVSKGVAPGNIESVILNAPATDGRSHVAVRIRN